MEHLDQNSYVTKKEMLSGFLRYPGLVQADRVNIRKVSKIMAESKENQNFQSPS